MTGRRCMTLIVAGLFACWLSATGWGQEPGPASSPAAPQPSDGPLAELEKTFGELSIRPIYFWESQAPKLIPRNYWPVYLEELRAALERENQVAEPGQQRPLLSSAFYVATYENGVLTSQRDGSLLNIVYESDVPGSMNLGPVNLALSPPQTAARDESSRLVTLPDGTLQAMIRGDGRIRFGWSRRGRAAADGTQVFDLQIPVCGRTRLLIGTPEGYRLDCQDGVLTRLPSPPPEAAGITTERSNIWHSIEAGGLARLRLSVAQTNPSRPARRQFVVRSQGTEVTAGPTGTDWTTRMQLDVPLGTAVPPLIVSRHSRVTAIRRDGEAVRWRESEGPAGTRVELVTQPARADRVSGPPDNGQLTTTLEITGTFPPLCDPPRLHSQPSSDGDPRSAADPPERSPHALPWVRLAATDNLVRGPAQEIALRVEQPLRLASLADLSDSQWRVEERGEAAGEAGSDYRLTGPLNTVPPPLRVVIPRQLRPSHALLELGFEDNLLRADWTAEIDFGPGGPHPITFRLQPGWRVTAISLGENQRPVDIPETLRPQSVFTVWPEPDDLSGDTLRVALSGTREQPLAPQSRTFEPTWFVRSDLDRLRTVAALRAPSNYQWPSDVRLRARLLTASELPAGVQRLLENTANDPTTLLFEIGSQPTPAIELKQPPADFSSRVDYEITRRGDLLRERLRIWIRVPSQGVPPVRVALGPRGNRPLMRWSHLSASDEVAATDGFAARDISQPEGGDEAWEITADTFAGDTLVLLGEREYPFAPWWQSLAESGSWTDQSAAASGERLVELSLPTVSVAFAAEATTHRGQVRIGPGLDLRGMTDNVLKIPRTEAFRDARTPDPSIEGDDAAADLVEGGADEGSRGDTSPATPAWLLRYAPDQQAAIRIAADALPRRAPTIVWHQETVALAGMAGDTIATRFEMDRAAPFILRHDPAMAVRGTNDALLEPLGDEPGLLRVVPDPGLTVVEIRWWRPAPSAAKVRSFSVPPVEIDGLVLQAHCSVWASRDALAWGLGERAEPPRWMAGEAGPQRMEVGRGERLWLVPANAAIAAGVAAAMLCFALGTWFIRRHVIAGLGVLLLAAGFAAFTPVWNIPTIAFFMLPWAAAGVLVSSRQLLVASREHGSDPTAGLTAATDRNSEATRITAPGRSPRPSAAAEPTDPRASTVVRGARVERAGSGSRKLHGWLWLLALCGGSASLALAQEQGNGDTTSTRRSVEVLIPLTADGALAGDEVYVPKSLKYGLLRKPTRGPATGELEFLSAEYQTRIIPIGMGDSSDEVNIEATWRVSVDSIELPVRLPIPPEYIDRLELITESVPNEIRPIPDGDGVRIRLPRSGVSVLRAALSPPAELTVAGANRLALSIPPVAASTITVTSESPFEQINLPNCRGGIDRSGSGNRVSAQLGAIERLEVIWQRRTTSTSGRWEGVQRRWRVDASPHDVTREVELDLGNEIRAGVVVELVADRPELPVLTTGNWALTSSDASGPEQLRMRMIAQIDSPGPIRLLWSDPTEQLNLSSLSLPDIRPATLRGPLPTLVGLRLAAGWALSEFILPEEIAEDSVNSLPPPDFSDAWLGASGEVSLARRYERGGPSGLRLVRPSRSPGFASVTHRIQVRPGELDVDCRCQLQTGSGAAAPITLRLPPGVQFDAMRINGSQPATISVQRGANAETEILLPPLPADSQVEIELRARRRLTRGGTFRLPRIALAGIRVRSAEMHLLRSHDARLRTQPSAAAREAEGGWLDPIPLDIEYDLPAALVPVASWNLPQPLPTDALEVGSQYRVVAVEPQLDANSLITLRWNDGLWTMQADFEIEMPRQTVDFLVFEVPSRWEEALNIDPAIKWFSEISPTPAKHLVQVLPATDPPVPSGEGENEAGPLTGRGQSLRIRMTSTLETAGEGGVSVPDIRLLGGGQRRRFFATPRKLTNNPVTWQTQNARPVEASVVPLEETPEPASHAFYEVVGETFTANLQPNTSGAESARIPLMEMELFPADEASVVAMLRMHLLPGARDAVTLDMPPGGTTLGAWAGGQVVDVRQVDVRTAAVPVGISRLAQTMTVLVRLPRPEDHAALRVPRVQQIPVETTWCIRYDERDLIAPRTPGSAAVSPIGQALAQLPGNTLRMTRDALFTSEADDGWAVAAPESYNQQVARALSEMLDAAVDSVAERPAEEKRQWLQPWLARLQQLRWKRLEAWTPRFTQRVFGSETAPLEPRTASRGVVIAEPLGRWAPSRVVHREGATGSIPPSMLPRHTPDLERWAGLTLSAVIALGCCSLLVLLRWRFRINLTIRPYLWMALLGMCLLPLMPVGVGLATLGLSLLLPLLQRWC